MAKKSFVRRIYRRAGRRMGRVSIPVMGVITGGVLATSLTASSGGQPSASGDTPVAWAIKGDYNKALTKLHFNLSKASTYTPVIIPLAVWGVGRMLLGKVRLTKKISLF